MASRRLEDLKPLVRKMAVKFQENCAAAGYDILIYCTLRSEEEQNELYAQGRTKPGKIVTNARGGESWHNFGCAIDYVPLVGGKPQWGNSDLYLKTGIIAEMVGFEWAGRWTGKLRETAHCQYRDGKTLKEMREEGWRK